MLAQTTLSPTQVGKDTSTFVAIGATYEGRDPNLLDRMLPLVDYIEITPETIAEVHDHEITLSDETMTELKNIGKATPDRRARCRFVDRFP